MSIRYYDEYKTFWLEGDDFSYVMNVSEYGYLSHKYYGAKIPFADLGYYRPECINSHNAQIPGSKTRLCELLFEYAVPFRGDYREPSIVTRDKTGCRVIDLKYDGYEILEEKPCVLSGIPTARGKETLKIKLKDIKGLAVWLFYTVYEKENIITRRAEIINDSDGDIYLEKALSAVLDIPDGGFELITLCGHHAGERTPQRSPLMHGRMSVGNVRGVTSHQHASFAALVRKDTDEERGEAFAVTLTYSGSHYESAEVDDAGRTRLSVGINPEAFEWKLDVGGHFETPEAVFCYSDAGIGKMTRSYHDFFRGFMIDPKWVNKHRPVVLNSWEGMHFKFDRDRLFSTIDRLGNTGIEIFVLDDGWFGARNNDKAGLGDWYVNEEKLPGGLKAVSDRCHENGIGFGLWIEPEMINPDSDLYRAHPDWAITAPGREGVQSRNQYVLDLSRRDVLEYIKKVMYDVISTSGADYIKWDMNRSLSENWSYMLEPDREGELQHRYVLGVYELARYLTESFPNILFEGCSGGGGRFDGAMLSFFPQTWTSDNSDAHDRIKIQHGTGMLFPLSTISNHVSLSPNIRNGRIVPLSTRTNVAYNGVFGYEFDLDKVPPKELEQIPKDIAKYRELEELIQTGDLYRGKNTFEGNEMTEIIVSKDKKHAHLTHYQALNPHKMSPRIKVPGLCDSMVYRVEELGISLPGAVLRLVGLVLPRYKCDFASATLTFTAEESEAK